MGSLILSFITLLYSHKIACLMREKGRKKERMRKKRMKGEMDETRMTWRL